MNYKEAEVICKGGNMPTKQLVMSAQSGELNQSYLNCRELRRGCIYKEDAASTV